MSEKVEFEGFEWDEANLNHATRHGISRKEIEEAVSDGVSVYFSYVRNGEPRYTAVGKTRSGMLIDINFTMRSGKLRPISVHKLKRNKRRRYEKEV